MGPGGGLRYIWGGKKSNEMGFDGGSLGRVGSNQIKLPFPIDGFMFVVWLCFLILLFFIFCLVTSVTEPKRRERKRGEEIQKRSRKPSKGCGWARRGKIYSSEFASGFVSAGFLLLSSRFFLASFFLFFFSF